MRIYVNKYSDLYILLSYATITKNPNNEIIRVIKLRDQFSSEHKIINYKIVLLHLKVINKNEI
jgi:hypothetical protein